MIFSWKISGEAGFGITTVGLTFSKICARHGLQVYDYAEFPSLIRGGFTNFEITVSDEGVQALQQRLDMLVCLRQDGFDRDAHRLTDTSIVIYDQDTVKVEGDFIQIPMPFKAIRTKHKAFQVMVNTISFGATLAILNWDISSFNEILEEEFGRKGQDVIQHNVTLAQEGWDHVKNLIAQDEVLRGRIEDASGPRSFLSSYAHKQPERTSLIITGNEAFALASVMADCRAYFAYPMSPASSVLSVLAAWAKDTKMVVRHVEDEIAAISEAIGSAFAGVRSSVGTSGGGFALMVETISYAGVAEIPLVIYLAQRPGPATGLPTWTGQGDLLFAVHAGHGEFPKIVLAPGDVQEMIELSIQAYNLADVYQVPVIVLSDKHLAESHITVQRSWLKGVSDSYAIERGKIVANTTQTPYLRYKDSPDGISEYLLPGFQKGVFWQANSYEHLEDTHTTEEAPEVMKQVDKRRRKIDTYLASNDYAQPKVFGNMDTAKTIFVSYGSNKGAIQHAQHLLKEKNIDTAYLHFTHLYPLSEKVIRPLFEKQATYILVENDNEGQFGQLLREQCGITIEHKLLKYDGRPIFVHEIVSYVKNLT
ncbi:2-oxoacid:acceptor oxidoreductase subunit alpha [Candidatus Woesebacteria bacterium]|nr:2-oxoacid:acceptor oxidoreductase subunit alpha [Candidatus Woesebacteria bacterium]